MKLIKEKSVITGKRETKGFVCDCGDVHRFPAYVYAHWQDDLTYKCPGCNRIYDICEGQVEQRVAAAASSKEAE